ncbi:HNH endonuclease [Flavobacterium sp. PLA-1-15]|uniref:HNH endonuclease n=1 Tax=Flavobacterium sp. PLA-1-15 TaxID=3380533 RepID=UPI003B82200D
MNNIIYNTDDDFDEESGSVLKQSRFLNFEQIFQNSTNPLEETIKRSRSGNSLENTSLPNRFGKDSIFYQAKEDSLRHFLESRNLYQPAKSKYEGIDLEKILINITDFNNIDDLPYFCKKGNRLRIIQYTAEEPNSLDEYLKKYFTINSKKISTYTDNFIWFTEGEDSNLITFHLFAYDNRISEIICTMGSDIFDCLKSTTNVNSSGGFIIRNNKDENIVNPVLDDFKKEIAKRVEKLYYSNNAIDSDKKFYIRTEELIEALDREFQAEGDYQRTIDWIFEKMEITTSFKDFVNKLHDYSKDIQSYRLGEERYLPFHPNFDPIFNDTLLKAFGINPNIKIEDYFLEWDQEDIEKFKLVEKEVNVAYGFNAFFCGLWNALVDTIDGFVLMIPELHEIFTDRAKFKSFLHLIKELFEHINEWEDKINEWELKNSSYSVYRYEYFQTYGTILILSLFLPLPKLAKGGKSAEAFTFFEITVKALTEREVILLAYKLGLRIEKTGEKWTLLFQDIAITAGAKEKIALRVEQITSKGLIPIEEAFGLGRESTKLLQNLKLQLKINIKTIDIVETGGQLFFRLDPQDLKKLVDFLKLSKPERRIKIKQATQDLRLHSKAKYNPANAKAKGFDIPKSKNGISADFAKTPYLYNENSIVKIRMTGSRSKDFEICYSKIGINDLKTIEQIEEKFVWHHLDDLNELLECTMQLVLKEAHKATYRHIGSCGQIDKVLTIKYKP